mmetsp:Transcript_10026/g.24705  ORF Transcript_10026/g.24705 Transcript_10026/m.24705 type:complete len:221 (+) Transcript_10026:103-765(+)
MTPTDRLPRATTAAAAAVVVVVVVMVCAPPAAPAKPARSRLKPPEAGVASTTRAVAFVASVFALSAFALSANAASAFGSPSSAAHSSHVNCSPRVSRLEPRAAPGRWHFTWVHPSFVPSACKHLFAPPAQPPHVYISPLFRHSSPSPHTQHVSRLTSSGCANSYGRNNVLYTLPSMEPWFVIVCPPGFSALFFFGNPRFLRTTCVQGISGLYPPSCVTAR